MSIRDNLAAESEHYENDADVPVPPDVAVTRPGRERSVMMSLRLNPDEDAAIRQIAEALDVPVSSLVRGLIVQRIAAERGDVNLRAQAFAEMYRGMRHLMVLDGIDELPSAGVSSYVQDAIDGATAPR